MSTSEVYFLKAEAGLRGWSNAGSIQDNYKEGVRLSMEQWGVGGIDKYLADDSSTAIDYKDTFASEYDEAAVSKITIKWDDSANNMKRHFNELKSTSGRLSSEGNFFLGAGSTINSTERIEKSEVRSIYGFTSESNLQTIAQNGYSHMIFAMDPNRANLNRQKSALEKIARILYNDELVYNGNPYPKDWGSDKAN